MLFRNVKLVVASSFVLILSISLGPTYAKTGVLTTFDQAKDWNEIIRLAQEGFDVLDKWYADTDDDPKLWARRMQIFKDAADKLTTYIRTYVKDPKDPTYLRTKFRLGTYLEISRQLDAARAAYSECRDHPLLSSAMFDGKPLAPQVTERLEQVNLNLKKQYSRKPGHIYVHRGGGAAIFEEPDHEFLPPQSKDLCP